MLNCLVPERILLAIDFVPEFSNECVWMVRLYPVCFFMPYIWKIDVTRCLIYVNPFKCGVSMSFQVLSLCAAIAEVAS